MYRACEGDAETVSASAPVPRGRHHHALDEWGRGRWAERDTKEDSSATEICSFNPLTDGETEAQRGEITC